MKVLLVNKFHYMKGGSETYYFALGNMLAAKGHEVIYFSMKDDRNLPCDQEKYFVENVDYNSDLGVKGTIKASLDLLYNVQAYKRFKQLLIDEKPDVIHLNIFQSQLTASIVDAAKELGVPMVYTAHDLKTVCPTYLMMNNGKICDRCLHGDYMYCIKSKCMKNSRAKSLLAVMESQVYRVRHTYEKLDAIITPSQHHKRRLAEGGIQNKHVLYIPNFLPEGTVFENIEGKRDYILYFGRLSVEKGIMTLLRAYAKSKVTRPLYVVGTGPQEQEIKDFVSENQLQYRIKILGFKSGEELREVVSNALFICLPSECCENAPYSVMEAQSMGKPVIVSDNGGLPELVEEGVTGSIFKAGDVDLLAEKLEKMENTAFDGTYIVKMAQKKYSCKNYVRKLEKLYRYVCEH